MPNLEVTRSIVRAVLGTCRQEPKVKNAFEAVLRRSGATKAELEAVLIELRAWLGIASDSVLGTIVATEGALKQIESGWLPTPDAMA